MGSMTAGGTCNVQESNCWANGARHVIDWLMGFLFVLTWPHGWMHRIQVKKGITYTSMKFVHTDQRANNQLCHDVSPIHMNNIPDPEQHLPASKDWKHFHSSVNNGLSAVYYMPRPSNVRRCDAPQPPPAGEQLAMAVWSTLLRLSMSDSITTTISVPLFIVIVFGLIPLRFFSDPILPFTSTKQ